jgi:flavin reductase (DIM6/NTAB) family NADH-FMN oxidoreductase RutF
VDGRGVTTFTAALGPLQLRQVFSTFPTGVTAIAAVVDGKPTGIAVSSFTSVSLDPPMVLVCISRTSTTWPTLARATMFGISVLSADQEQACRQLSERSKQRFAGLEWHATDNGAVVLDGASAWLECSFEYQCQAGDHDIVVLRVHNMWGDHSVPPLVFHGSRIRRLHLEPTPEL